MEMTTLRNKLFLVLTINEEGDLVQHGLFLDRLMAESEATLFPFGLVLEATRCERLPIVKKRGPTSYGEKSCGVLVLPIDDVKG